MYVCPQCARSFEDTRFAGGSDSCPACGAEMPQHGDENCIDVARVSNLAEAGFLTDELVGIGVDAQIHQLNEFSALTDRWDAVYLIRVPAAEARAAAGRIREYLAEETGDDASLDGEYRLTSEHAMDPLLWRPLALVILASVASFVMGQRFSEMHQARDERRLARSSLASAVSEIDRPFVTDPAGGRPGHRLQFDRRRQSWLLDTDHDGDGRYETRRLYHAAGSRR